MVQPNHVIALVLVIQFVVVALAIYLLTRAGALSRVTLSIETDEDGSVLSEILDLPERLDLPEILNIEDRPGRHGGRPAMQVFHGGPRPFPDSDSSP